MIEEMNKVKALFPDNVEKIIISKDDYDRLTGELTLENIELKQEIERLQFIINEAREEMENTKHISVEDVYHIIEHEKKLNEILDKVQENK